MDIKAVKTMVKKIILLFLILLLFSTTAAEAQGWLKIRIRVENKDLTPGAVFSGMERVVISPESSDALQVDISSHHRLAGERYEVTFPQEEVILYNDNGDTLLATDFETSLEGNIGVVDDGGDDQFTLGATIKNISYDVPSGHYVSEPPALIYVEFMDL